MIAPKFIRFKKNIIKVDDIQEVILNNNGDTCITYSTHGHSHWLEGDVRDELWELIKLALQPKDVAQPDITFLEKRVIGIEDKIGPNFTKKNRLADSSVPAGMPSHVGFTLNGEPIYERDGVLITLEA